MYIGLAEGDLLDSRTGQFEEYVRNGGGLIVAQPGLVGTVDVYPPGFEMTVTDVTWPEFPRAPGPVEFTGAGASHPILAGITPADLSGNFDTIPLSTLGPGWTLLAKSVAYPHVALAAGNYGAGRLVFHSGNIAFASSDEGSDQYVQQMIEWTAADQPTGPDMQIEAIEVTQAIQDLNNSVALIFNKRTFVRVHVTSPTSISNVTANLSGTRSGATLFPTLIPLNPGADITILPTPDRGQLNDSFLFELPLSWVAEGNLTLTARLDPANAKNDPDLSNNTMSVTVNFKRTPPLRVRVHNVRYTVDGVTYIADDFHLRRLQRWLRRAYPVPSLRFREQTFIYPGSDLPNVNTLNAWLTVNRLLRILFMNEDTRFVYYGIVDDGGGFMRGKAAGIPGRIASGPTGVPNPRFSWDTDGSYGDWYGGHEIGHTLNRYHAEFCGARGGRSYPYPNGRISPSLTGDTAIYGFNPRNYTIYDPTWKDVMTYCQNQWISDFTYEGIRDYLVASLSGSAALNLVAADEFLVVSGLADLRDNTAQLLEVYLINQTKQLPLPEPGDWSIVLLNPSKAELAAYPFTPDRLTDDEEEQGQPAIISEIVPWVDGANKVEIRYNDTVVASRTTSANAPTVDITAPQSNQQLPGGSFTFKWSAADSDGDPLTYSVLYSNDGRKTWESLSVGLKENQLVVDTDSLPGGDSSFLRVIASDGLLTGMDTIGPFSTPTGAPAVTIIAPTGGQTFSPGQLVIFEGSARDREDGDLEGQALQWSSSQDGDLGQGTIIDTVDLSTGEHDITLIATDSDGQTGQAQVTIEVLSGQAPEPATLEVSVTALGETFVVDSAAPKTYPLTIRNGGEGALNWSAGVDKAWLKLSAAGGATPSDLTVTIDPTGLAVGSYQGEITLQSNAAANSPLVIPVVLDIVSAQDQAIYLPLIVK